MRTQAASPLPAAHAQVAEVYHLLLDDSHAIRHAAAELVADLLEELGHPPPQAVSGMRNLVHGLSSQQPGTS